MDSTISPANSPSVGMIAGADLTGMRYRVASSSGGRAVLAGVASMPLGILQDDAPLDKAASIISHGYSYGLLGGTVTENAVLASAADGRLQTLTDGQISVAVALEDGSVDGIIRVRLSLGGSGGGAVAPPVTADPPTPITFNAHGFDLTTTEGERMPRALYFDGATWSVPTNDGDVTHFAVTAPDANTVGVRTRAEMQGRTYTAITNTGGGVGEFLLFDPANGLHSSTLTEGLVLGQIGQDATTEFTFDVFPSTAATGTGTDTRSSLRITEFDMAASVATNQVINLNGDTAGVLTYREGYQLHGWPTAAAAFNDGYGNTFWIEWGGQKLLQGDWQPVTANSIRYVGTGLSIVGAEIRVVSQVTETV